MSRLISDMKNLGPKCQLWLAAIDVHTEDDLRKLGAAEAFHRSNFFNQLKPHKMYLYALEASLRDIDMNWLSAEDKAEIVKQAGLD